MLREQHYNNKNTLVKAILWDQVSTQLHKLLISAVQIPRYIHGSDIKDVYKLYLQ